MRAGSPSGSAAMNTIPLVDSVTPSANDMMLPLSVMKVMPTATQPMNEVVFKSENRLTVVKKPGVADGDSEQRQQGSDADRHQHRPRLECGSGSRQCKPRKAVRQTLARSCLFAHGAASTGWVMSATMRCMETSLRR